MLFLERNLYESVRIDDSCKITLIRTSRRTATFKITEYLDGANGTTKSNSKTLAVQGNFEHSAQKYFIVSGVRVTIMQVNKNSVRICFEAPVTIQILRQEIYDQMHEKSTLRTIPY
ncbi:MAG: carbon storage regulator [Patescibacteria group bacterium]